MKFSVSSRTHLITVTRPEVSAEYAHEVNPGSEVYTIDGLFGKVVSQEINTGVFSLLHDFYEIREKFSLQFRGEAPVLQILVCAKGRLHFTIAGLGDIHLQQGQFIILYVPAMDASVFFELPAELLTFNLYLPVDVIQPFAEIFPIQPFINEMAGNRPALLFQRPGWVTHEILRSIAYLLAFHHNDAMRAYFFELKVKSLLVLFLHQKFYTGATPLTETTFESVRWAQHIIESHVGAIPALGEIAELVDIDIHLLKEHFKTVVGIDMHIFLIQARLNNARLLLQETDLPIREIAGIAGYSRPEDFTQAFKKQFDYTPMALRKRNI